MNEKLIGWRTADYTAETSDPDMAKRARLFLNTNLNATTAIQDRVICPIRWRKMR